MSEAAGGGEAGQRSEAMDRDRAIDRLRSHSSRWDVAVIGGGATGVAVALDAASRGFDVVLVEQADFGKGTSSRSTKLIHGGVRYLQQGDIALVRDALRERKRLADNAPHLVRDLPFLIPCQNWWQRAFYGAGLKVYDLLAAGDRFGRSHGVSAAAASALVPAIKTERLRGGVVYHDGQFDDARLLIAMVRSAAEHGACVVNYAEATELLRTESGKVHGLRIVDRETGEALAIEARAVVNAAGPFCDAVRRLDQPRATPLLSASQGVHLVLPRRFFPGDVALIVPRTSDDRVLFIIPWHDRALVGTTDTVIDEVSLEPDAQAEEIEFLLDTAAEYLVEPPQRSDVLSLFTGIRPLVKQGASSGTSGLSRDHLIHVADSDLVTITGGKWTTARKMGEDCVDRVIEVAGLPARRCATRQLRLHGWRKPAVAAGDDAGRSAADRRSTEDPTYRPGDEESAAGEFGYGSEQGAIEQLAAESAELAERLHPSLNIRGAEVLWAVRYEMARSVEDVLARRTRALLLDARAAIEIAPEVARRMAEQLKRDRQWTESQVKAFGRVAEHYLPPQQASEASELAANEKTDDRSDQQTDRDRDRQSDGDR